VNYVFVAVKIKNIAIIMQIFFKKLRLAAI